MAVAPARSPAEQWQALSVKLEAVGNHYKLISFCKELRPKLKRGQAKRDFLEGPNAWRPGRGRGTKLQSVEKKGSRGGIPATYVRKEDLEQVFYKYYGKKHAVSLQ